MDESRKEHWEKVYETKTPDQVSWTQHVPQPSLDLINNLQLPTSANIIDIGGGDSRLVDFLLDAGFENITVLDISDKALQRAKQRLGKRAEKVTWIESDILMFKPERKYDLWHDRAAFHFLTTTEQTSAYARIAEAAVAGYMIVGSFSDEGPEKCSGLPISRYSETSLPAVFKNAFRKINCFKEDHNTPFNTVQNFVFCSFERIR